jgi:hypothetical protein
VFVQSFKKIVRNTARQSRNQIVLVLETAEKSEDDDEDEDSRKPRKLFCIVVRIGPASLPKRLACRTASSSMCAYDELAAKVSRRDDAVCLKQHPKTSGTGL